MAVLVHRILHRGPVSHWLLSYLPEINFLGLAAAGTAPKYAFHTKINAQILSSMITFSENPEVVLRVKAFGKAMAQKNGVSCAVEYIERLMARSS